jgi:signal transduction histidine kinase
MRGVPAAAGTLFLLLLLSWTLLNGLNLNSFRYDRELRTLDDFSGFERGLNREVLTARAGLTRNYDPLVHASNALDNALDRLRDAAGPDSEELSAIGDLAARVRQQENMVEQFKSKNALLRNSFAYFETITARLAASDHKPVARIATALVASVLRLSLDSSQQAVQEMQDQLTELASLQHLPDDADSIRALLAHGGMLYRLLPETDALLRAMMNSPSNREQDAVRSVIVKHQLTARTSARHYRILLYAFSLTLLGILVYLGLQLRARAISLYRRSAFEHVIASASTGFISSPRNEIATEVERALRRLADRIGADRAYFVVRSDKLQVYQWSDLGVEFPEGWPERALEFAARISREQEGTIHIPNVGKSRTEAVNPAMSLLPSDLYSWLCVPSAGQGADAILGFDALRPGTLTQWTELSLTRMAFDSISNAVNRAALEQEKQRLQTSLQQARRMETIGAFASGIAHNFNNIIGAILGYTEMAYVHARSGGRPATNLSEIRRAGERARELIGQILKFGRRSESGREHVSLRALVKETGSLLAASLPSHVGISIRDSSDAALVSAEPAQLQQVILNVCNNAAQAMDEPGAIEIEIHARDLAHEQQVGNRELGPGRFTVISISDPGRGMDEATMERMFEPFFTTRTEGNGLGLATVREIVLEHDGAVDVKSAIGAGTRVDIWLPSLSSDQKFTALQALRPAARGRGETVLVLESDRASLLRHEEVLAALGYEPVGFSNLADAAATCRLERKRFDAILVCHQSLISAALESAKALREIAPTLPIILATASTRELGVPLLAASGISEVIHYPLTSSELAGALSRCLRASAA